MDTWEEYKPRNTRNPPWGKGGGYFWQVQQENSFKGGIKEWNGSSCNDAQDAQNAQEDCASQNDQAVPLLLHILIPDRVKIIPAANIHASEICPYR